METPDNVDKRKRFTAWVFRLLATVDADPLLQGSPCLSVIRVYAHFASHKQKDPTAYASNITLMVHTGRSRPTVRKAREQLVQRGYLVPSGSTESGITIFQIKNAGEDRVQMHLMERKWALEQEEIARKEQERRKRALRERGKNVPPQNDDRGERILPERGKEAYPNPLDQPKDRWAGEGEAHFQGDVSDPDPSPVEPSRDDKQGRSDKLPQIDQSLPQQGNTYSDAKSGEFDQPYDPPETDVECEAFINLICEGRNVPPRLLKRLKSMLETRILTPRLVAGILDSAGTDVAA